ncbi:MAG: hypothetical protein JNK34_11200, partial [Tabrizicola sp.]|nr:hypothetical protein [Tabrizicola sp.]
MEPLVERFAHSSPRDPRCLRALHEEGFCCGRHCGGHPPTEACHKRAARLTCIRSIRESLPMRLLTATLLVSLACPAFAQDGEIITKQYDDG